MKLFSIVLSALLLAGCSIFGGDDIDLSAPAELQDFESQLNIKKVWNLNVGSGAEAIHPVSIPVLQNGVIYVGDHDGRLQAVDAESGSRIWLTDTEETITGAVGVGTDLVLIGTQEGEVQAFDKTSGSLRWKTPLSSEILAPPNSNSEVVVVVTLDGKIYGLNASDGSRLWLADVNLPILTVRGNAKPTVVDDTAYIGLDNGKIAAYRMDDGIKLWELRVGLPEGRNDLERMVDIDGEPLYHNGNLYAAAYQSGIMGINPQAGRGLWFQEGSTINRLGAFGGTLAVTMADGTVKAFNSSDGTLLWETEEFKNRGLNAPVLTNDFIVFTDSDGYLHFLTRRSGELIGRVKVGGEGSRAPTINDGDRVFVLTNDGSLVAYQVSEL